MEGKKTDSLKERLGAIAELFLCCHNVNITSMRLMVLEDLISGETKELLHDLAGLMLKFGEEIDKEIDKD